MRRRLKEDSQQSPVSPPSQAKIQRRYCYDVQYDDRLVSALHILQRIKVKAKGIIWKRDSMELGGNFRKCYAVLEKGKLDFYKSEDVRARP